MDKVRRVYTEGNGFSRFFLTWLYLNIDFFNSNVVVFATIDEKHNILPLGLSHLADNKIYHFKELHPQ